MNSFAASQDSPRQQTGPRPSFEFGEDADPIKPAGIWKAASFFVPPSRTLDEIATRTGGAYPTVTREVRRLHESGLLEVEEIGRSKRVRLNPDPPMGMMTIA